MYKKSIVNSPAATLKNSLFVEALTEIGKRFAQFGKMPNLVPDVPDKSILSTFSSASLYDSITISIAPNIPPLSAPEEFYEPLSNPLPTTTDEVYDDRIPSEHSVPFPYIDRRKKVRKVLIVGGLADDTNQSVARFIEHLGFEAIIISEQPNGGSRTKFDKFKAYTNVDFVITLLTPDDVGKTKDSPDKLKLRPSQDTIFGLAYLCKQFPPEKILTLYTEKIELPSYLEGWIQEPMCSGDSWKLKLVQEMEFAGFLIDKNKIL